MASAVGVIGAVGIGVLTAILRIRQVLGDMRAERARQNELQNWYDPYVLEDRLRMEVNRLTVSRSDDPIFLLKWFFLPEVIEFQGHTDVEVVFSAADDEGELRNRFLGDRLDLFEDLPVSNGSVDEKVDGTVVANFRVHSAEVEDVKETIQEVVDRMLVRSFNDYDERQA